MVQILKYRVKNVAGNIFIIFLIFNIPRDLNGPFVFVDSSKTRTHFRRKISNLKKKAVKLMKAINKIMITGIRVERKSPSSNHDENSFDGDTSCSDQDSSDEETTEDELDEYSSSLGDDDDPQHGFFSEAENLDEELNEDVDFEYENADEDPSPAYVTMKHFETGVFPWQEQASGKF